LRRAGKKEQSDAVRALRKPTLAVWAANQSARRAPRETRALVDAGGTLRKAQRAAVSGRDPDALREAQRAHRERLDDLTSFARHELELSDPNVQRMAQLLRAASIDKEASKSLLAGTLAGDVEEAGFGPLLSLVPPGRRRPARRPARAKEKPKSKPTPTPTPAPRPKAPPKPKRDPNAARRARIRERLEKARERVRELEAQLDELGAE
jgi:signal transduction histidine kinase